jgi:hypothetical protein
MERGMKPGILKYRLSLKIHAAPQRAVRPVLHTGGTTGSKNVLPSRKRMI